MKVVTTRRTEYGIRAMVHLARARDHRATAAEIADAREIPEGFLHQVMQELQRAGLVSSAPGRNGGYRLARSPRDISLRDVVDVLEPPLVAADCVLRGGPCRLEDPCEMHGVWSAARDAVGRELARASLSRVAARSDA